MIEGTIRGMLRSLAVPAACFAVTSAFLGCGESGIQRGARAITAQVVSEHRPLACVVLVQRTADCKVTASVVFRSRPGDVLDRNPDTTDYVFEPGTIVSTFILAAAMEEGVADTSDVRVFREDEDWERPDWATGVTRDFDLRLLTMMKRLGGSKLRDYLSAFGFQLDIQSDTLSALDWVLLHNGMNIIRASASSVANAYCILANGGVDMRTKRRVLSPATCRRVRDILADRAHHGSARAAYSERQNSILEARVRAGSSRAIPDERFHVAGEGNVAPYQVLAMDGITVTGRRYENRYLLYTFCGLLPASDPDYVVFILVKGPTFSVAQGHNPAVDAFPRVASLLTR